MTAPVPLSAGAIPTGTLDDDEPTPVPDSAPAPASIQTVTMADLFVQQGHAAKAIPIYERLLAEDPSNVTLREKLITARRAAFPPPEAGVVPQPSPRTPDDEPTEPPIGEVPTSWDTVPDFAASELAPPAATLPAMSAPATASAAPATAPESQLDLDPAPPAAQFAFLPEPAPTPELGLSAEDPRWSMGSSPTAFDVTASTQPDADGSALAAADRLRSSLEKVRSRRRAPSSAPALAGKEP